MNIADSRRFQYGTAALVLLAKGYEPIPIRPGEKRPAPAGWQRPAVTDFEVWRRSHPACGVGLLTRTIPAVDIDFQDAAVGNEIEALARQMLGDSPLLRFGKYPKRLLAYRAVKSFVKLKSHVVLAPDDPADGKGHAVEILGDGQQFVAFGIHPDTQRPYDWPNSSPLMVCAGDLPAITAEQAETFITAVNEMIETRLVPAGWRYRHPAKAPQAPRDARHPAGTSRPTLGSDPFAPLKSAALADLAAWVPDLIPGAVRHGSGWRCTATWRDCVNSNVGIHPSGIRDFGGDAGLSAIDLVMRANRFEFIEAARALAERLGLELPERPLGLFQPRPAPVSPAPDPAAPSVDQARVAVAEAITEFSNSVVTYWADAEAPVPQVAVAGATGLGKSAQLRQVIPTIRHSIPDRPVCVFVPTLKLADEACIKAKESGLRSAVLRGRDADAPGGGKMCVDPDAVADAINAGDVVQSAVCRTNSNGTVTECQNFAACEYQKQRAEAQEADVIYLPHQYLFTQKPEFLTTPSAVVIDEAFWQVGIAGNGMKLIADELRNQVFSVMHKDRRSDFDTADLHAANQKLAAAIAACTGPLTAMACTEAGVTEENSGTAYRLWWKCKMPSGNYPGVCRAQRKENRRRVEFVNKSVTKYSLAWKVVRDMLRNGEDCTAFIKCGDIDLNDGIVKGAILKVRRNISSGWNAPTLVLDATLRPELVTPYFPALAVRSVPYPKTPHASIVQILGAPVTKHKLSISPDRREKDQVTARNHLTNLARYIEIQAARYSDCLVVAQMETEAELRKLGLPGNVDLAHFNATRGIDRWNSVSYLLTVGRTLPGPEVVEALAAALTGEPVTPAATPAPAWRWYDADGAHHDPVAEAVRWSICEAEIAQTIGRARAVNRNPATPVVVEVMTDVPLPVPVNTTTKWAAPSRVAVMAARGWWIESPADRARCFPDLWGSAEVSKKDQPSRGKNAYIESSLKAFFPVLYQPTGPGAKTRTAHYHPARTPDPKSWLEQRLGRLARFEVQTSTPPAAESVTCQIVGTEFGVAWITADGRRWLTEPTPTDLIPSRSVEHVAGPPPESDDPLKVLGYWFPADDPPPVGITINGVAVEKVARSAGFRVIEFIRETLNRPWLRVGFGGCWDSDEISAASAAA